MRLDSEILKTALNRQRSGIDHVVDRSFDRGLETAIKIIIIFEQAELQRAEVMLK